MTFRYCSIRTVSVALALALSVLCVSFASRVTAGRETRSTSHHNPGDLAVALNPDGSLRAGAQGSFQTDGYRMTLSATGAPRFVAASPAAACNGWDTQFGLGNGVAQQLRAVLVNGSDVYVGGLFAAAGNTPANNVAKYDTLTNTWSALGTGGGNGVDDQVFTLALDGGNLYVGGTFTLANEGGATVSVNNVARVNLASGVWSALGTGGGNGVNDQVNVVLVNGADLYVGGQFTTANVGGATVTTTRVARVNTGTGVWSALGTGGGQGVGGDVEALALSGTDLYVGGNFTNANLGGTVVTVNRVARFDTGTGAWNKLGTGSGNGVNDRVAALALDGSTLYVGGSFTTANVGGTAVPVNRIAKFDTGTSAWSKLGTGSGNGVDSAVSSLALSGGTLFVAGAFVTANEGGATVNANQVASFNTTTSAWGALGTGGGNGLTPGNFVGSIAAGVGEVFVAGNFTTVNEGGPLVSVNNVARVNTTTGVWSALNDAGGGGNWVNGIVKALVLDGTNLYVGGAFFSVGNLNANNVAKFDTLTNTWSTLGTDGNGVDGQVFALALNGGQLFAGGSFFNANEGGTTVSTSFIAKVNLATGVWSKVGSGAGNGVNSSVNALVADGSDVYAGGGFATANVGGATVTVNRVAKVNATTGAWSALGTGGGAGVNNTVLALAVGGGELFVGGTFQTVNVGGTTLSVNRIAKVNTTTGVWSGLGTGGGNGVTTAVNALLLNGSELFVGGNFTSANVGGTTVSVSGLAKFDTGTNLWSALGSGGGNGVTGSPQTFALSGGDLYVGGGFTIVNTNGPTVSANRVAKLTLATGVWSALSDPGGGNGVFTNFNPPVSALALNGSEVFVGGSFNSAGDNKASLGLARFCPGVTGTPPVITACPPATQTVNAAAGQCAASVPFTVTASGSPAPNITCRIGATVITSPHSFPVGTSNIVCTASNGVAPDATCSFAVTVVDVQPPVFNACPGNQTVTTASSSGTTVNYPALGATDNCGVGVVCLPPSGSNFPLGTTPVTCTATDTAGLTGTCNFNVIVNQTCPALTINPPTLPSGQMNVPYTQALSATGGAAPYTFSLQAGALPPGLTLAANGTISGTPTAPGPASFTVAVTDANNCPGNRTYTIGIQCPPISISPTTLPNPVAGTPYSQTLTGTGGAGPYTFALLGGTLPPGLNLSGATLSGTPTTLGTFTFAISVTDTGLPIGPNFCSGNRTYTVTVACTSATLAPASLPAATLNTAYNQSLSAAPGGTTYTFAITAGALPPGLTLNSNGTLSGAPTQSGTFNFRVTATGVVACSGFRDYTLLVNCPVVTLGALTSATAGVNTNQTISVTPAGSYTFSLTAGNLPTGLTLNPSTGVISGLTATAGSFNFTVKAQTAGGCFGTQSYTLAVNCPGITLAALATPVLNQAYNQTLSVAPSGGNYSFAVTSGALPPGLTLNAATGVLSGTPATGGTYNFTITATGFGTCAGNQSYSFTLSSSCPTISLPASLPDGQPGQLYSQAVAATPSGSYGYAITAGALPPGVTLLTIGLLFGYPASAGSFSFTITATDNNNCTGEQAYSLAIGGSAVRAAVPGDFDGDGKSDLAIWRGLQSEWQVIRSTDNQLSTMLWGAQYAPYNDVPATADYDGDGKMDWAVYRRANGHFYVKCSANGTVLEQAPGAGDTPVAADYDGDGKADFAIWQSTTGVWTILRSRDNTTQTVAWGLGSAPYLDVPAVGDYDDDGKADLAVFRRSTGTWYIKRSADGSLLVQAWGLGTDVPVPGDYDGDGKTDLAVWRGAEGNWYVLRSSTGTYQTTTWGATWAGDVAVPGDYDGDGKCDVAVWRESEGKWYVRQSSDNAARTQSHGQSGDLPVTAKPQP